MEALKTFDIKELLKRQEKLDRKFDKKETLRERTPIRIFVAFLTELGELGQELKADWNYWKNHTKPIDRQKALEELSDCLHFYLSYINQKSYRNTGYQDMYFWKNFYSDFEIAFTVLPKIDTETENRIFGAILKIAEHTGSTEEEFLKIHHMVWERNLGERTKEEY